MHHDNPGSFQGLQFRQLEVGRQDEFLLNLGLFQHDQDDRVDVVHGLLLNLLISVAAQGNPKPCQKIPLVLNVDCILIKYYFQFGKYVLSHLDVPFQRVFPNLGLLLFHWLFGIR